MHDAKTNLSKLIAQVEAGEEVVIARNGNPVAKLVKIEPARRRRKPPPESWRGKVWIAPDFDELPEDLARAFGVIDLGSRSKPRAACGGSTRAPPSARC